ncbi:ketol-acid reductoisomerase (NADP(+)) [Iodidimonas muriae]|uniref:Ketol-acid reductoisomerase (NADP(+)) n=1 Tax=Iodidimonas muriae TaxID=261467 RepID=A0ABQ2LEQ2_9PROT|nr:ketol-acid reductoisomerase [Iodidimonas muriae]GGO14035.1 ketol-acid reductoisomerase (NADP(+)) [Iodidimonas muriae]
MALTVYTDKDVDMGVLKERRVAILGYGNQGHAHALNLRDSGVDVIIGARDQMSPSGARAKQAGFEVLSYAEATMAADVVMMTLPDEHIPSVYKDHVAPHLKRGAALGFAHGLAVHFGHITPSDDVDLFLIGPKGAGRWLRAEYEAGRGLACLVAVENDATGHAKSIALAYASGLGCGRAGMVETSFREECETDLFGEQAVLCGGIPDLIEAGYDTLVEAGYSPEVAYFECLHEAKLIVDLMFEAGPQAMRKAISNTAEYGGYLAGETLVTEETRARMKDILSDIQSGAFAQKLMDDTARKSPHLDQLRERYHKPDLEAVGVRVRGLMPWLSPKR